MPRRKSHPKRRAPEPEGRRVRDAGPPEMEWNEITRPGCYLMVGSGQLVRVRSGVVGSGHPPLVSITTRGDTRVARLSDDAAAPISSLRTMAADNDYLVAF